jgi:hypothetical protein
MTTSLGAVRRNGFLKNARMPRRGGVAGGPLTVAGGLLTVAGGPLTVAGGPLTVAGVSVALASGPLTVAGGPLTVAREFNESIIALTIEPIF